MYPYHPYGKSLYKPYIMGIYHGYIVRGTPVLVPWQKEAFDLESGHLFPCKMLGLQGGRANLAPADGHTIGDDVDLDGGLGTRSFLLNEIEVLEQIYWSTKIFL